MEIQKQSIIDQVIESRRSGRKVKDTLNVLGVLVSLQDSIEALKENSEATDLKLVQFVYKKQYYTAVVYYPGGNMYGRIFYGNKIIAKVQDAEVICK